jgi:hypothetical protein
MTKSIIWNGIRTKTCDKTHTETRKRWNTTVSSGIPTNKQELLLNISQICCKMGSTEIKFTTKLWCVIFFACYASWICVTKMKHISLTSLRTWNIVWETQPQNPTSKHHITSQHCWKTVCVLNIWSPLEIQFQWFKWNLMEYPALIYLTQVVHMSLKWNFKD